MDKFDKIVMLIEHGFTKEEIEKILPDEPAATAEPEPAAAPAEPETEPAAEPEPAAAPAAVPEAMTTFMQEIKTGLQDLTKAVQAGNVNKITAETQTAEDMNALLANYINPPRE